MPQNSRHRSIVSFPYKHSSVLFLLYSNFYLLYASKNTNSKGKKSRGVTLSASPTKRVVGCKQAPLPITQTLDDTFTEDGPASSQVPHQKEMMITMLVDMSIRFQATEDAMLEMREQLTPCMLSPAALRVGQSKARAHFQPSPQAPDFSEAVRERMANRLHQLPIMEATTADKDSSSDVVQPAP